MRRWKLKFYSVVFLFVWLVFAGAVYALEVRCTTDLHGSLTKLPCLTALLQVTEEDTLRIDAGDTIQGSFSAHLDRGRSMIEALNLLKYDIWVPGNHDFEYGDTELAARCREFKGTVLGADWSCTGFAPAAWVLLEKEKKRIAVIGLSEPKMAKRQPPESGFVFKEPLKALEQAVAEIRKESPDHVILVWHNGIFSSQGAMSRILRKFPEIDLVIGGHTHQENPGQKIGNCYFIQPGSYGSCVGAVTFCGREITSRLLLPLPAEPHPELDELIRQVTENENRMGAERVTVELSPAERIRKQFQADAAIVTYIPPLKPQMTRRELFGAFPYDDRYTTRFFTRVAFQKFCKVQRKNQKRWQMSLDIAGELPPEGGMVALSYYLVSEMPEQKD